MSQPYIFYSWQSQLPNSSNRAFIRQALDDAVADLKADEEVSDADRPDDPGPGESSALRVLSATEGVPGAPDIAATILRRIESADIVVADVSIVNLQSIRVAREHLNPGSDGRLSDGSKPKPSPNPNVLYELGYAMAKIGDGRVILVLNEAFGRVEELPFDLTVKRPIIYNMPANSAEKASVRKRLASDLKEAVRLIDATRPAPVAEEPP